MLSRSPTSCIIPLGVLGRTCSCLPPLSCQPTPGGNSWPLALTLVELLGKNPGEAVWPSHPPQILNPLWEGCIQRKGQDPPLAVPRGTSCFIPGIFFCGNLNSRSGHGCLASLGWWTGSVTLFLPPRWPQWPGPSCGLPSPWQGPSQWRCPSSPSWEFCSWEAGCQPDQVPWSFIVVHLLSAPGSFSGRTLFWWSVPPSIPAPMVGPW